MKANGRRHRRDSLYFFTEMVSFIAQLEYEYFGTATLRQNAWKWI